MISSTALRSSSFLMKFQIGRAPPPRQVFVQVWPICVSTFTRFSCNQRARCDLKLAQSQPQEPSISPRSIASPMLAVPLYPATTESWAPVTFFTM